MARKEGRKEKKQVERDTFEDTGNKEKLEIRRYRLLKGRIYAGQT